MNNLIRAIPMFFLIGGCTSIYNVSKNSEFSEFVNREITLKKQVLVCRESPLKTEAGTSIEDELIYNIHERSNCPFGETIGTLPRGSKIFIARVEKHKLFYGKTASHIYFLGKSHMKDGKEFEFFYMYGHEGYYANQPW